MRDAAQPCVYAQHSQIAFGMLLTPANVCKQNKDLQSKCQSDFLIILNFGALKAGIMDSLMQKDANLAHAPDTAFTSVKVLPF